MIEGQFQVADDNTFQYVGNDGTIWAVTGILTDEDGIAGKNGRWRVVGTEFFWQGQDGLVYKGPANFLATSGGSAPGKFRIVGRRWHYISQGSTGRYEIHADVPFVNSHSDDAFVNAHSDTHSDTAFVNSHSDAAFVNSHSNVAHSNIAHTDVPFGNFSDKLEHSNTAHSDVGHSDVVFSNAHSDQAFTNAHTDTAFSNSHSDAHTDTAHSDAHSDTAAVVNPQQIG